MTYDEGAVVVPVSVLSTRIVALAPDADTDFPYDRVQLLTRAATHTLVLWTHDRSYISYGADSSDFPLCEDFADVCGGDIKRGAVRARLAVRPCFGRLDYTRKGGLRHAINWASYADGTAEFYEPQTDAWMPMPDQCQSMDLFRL